MVSKHYLSKSPSLGGYLMEGHEKDAVYNDPKAELTEICDQHLQQDTIMQICLLVDVLSVTKCFVIALRFRLQRFWPLRRSIKYITNQLEQTQENVRGLLMKNFQKVNELT